MIRLGQGFRDGTAWPPSSQLSGRQELAGEGSRRVAGEGMAEAFIGSVQVSGMSGLFK